MLAGGLNDSLNVTGGARAVGLLGFVVLDGWEAGTHALQPQRASRHLTPEDSIRCAHYATATIQKTGVNPIDSTHYICASRRSTRRFCHNCEERIGTALPNLQHIKRSCKRSAVTLVALDRITEKRSNGGKRSGQWLIPFSRRATSVPLRMHA